MFYAQIVVETTAWCWHSTGIQFHRKSGVTYHTSTLCTHEYMIILVLTPKCPGVVSDHMLESLVQYISLLSTTSGQVADEYTESEFLNACTRDSMFDF